MHWRDAKSTRSQVQQADDCSILRLCPSQQLRCWGHTLCSGDSAFSNKTGRWHRDLMLRVSHTRIDGTGWSWEGRGRSRELREAREEVLPSWWDSWKPSHIGISQTVRVKDTREHLIKKAGRRWWVRGTKLREFSHRPCSYLGNRLSGMLQSGFHISHVNGLISDHLTRKFLAFEDQW